ncbi:MAG: PilZ domain-containing protein [Planctomycetia bacterium]|jgi:hypothetical protein
MSTNQRRSNRFSLGLPCRFRGHRPNDDFRSAMIGDISRQGCSLLAAEPGPTIGARIEIFCSIAGADDSGPIIGDVVRREQTGTGCHPGIEFQSIDTAVKWDMIDSAYRRWQADHPAGAAEA